MSSQRIVHFVGGESGQWAITAISPVAGESLPMAPRLAVTDRPSPGGDVWDLAGSISNLRYTTGVERGALTVKQAGLGRPEATRAALIPISKSDIWWAKAQDERLAIYARSQHTAIGMDYLPAVARRLHHGRDLGEPFDFLTWFEFPAEAEADFDHMLGRLRATEEWSYVTREVDIRLTRIG
jgi:Chlorite dismutase